MSNQSKCGRRNPGRKLPRVLTFPEPASVLLLPLPAWFVLRPHCRPILVQLLTRAPVFFRSPMVGQTWQDINFILLCTQDLKYILHVSVRAPTRVSLVLQKQANGLNVTQKNALLTKSVAWALSSQLVGSHSPTNNCINSQIRFDNDWGSFEPNKY